MLAQSNSRAITNRAFSARAFTLVEVLIALAVLTFGVAEIYDQFRRTSLPGEERLLAAKGRMLAHQKLEELRACAPDALKAWPGDPAFRPLEEQPRFHLRRGAKMRADGAIELRVEAGWDPTDTAGQQFPEGKLVTVQGLSVP